MQDQNDAKEDEKRPDKIDNLAFSSTLFYCGMAGVGAMISFYRHHSLTTILSLPKEPTVALKLLLFGILGALVLLIANYLFEEQFPSYKGFRHVLMRLVGKSTVLTAIYLSFISALGEELLFRGAIQPSLGLIGTSFLFGLLHLGPQGLVSIWTLWAIISGLMMGWIFDASGSLWPALICHFVVNTVSILTLRLQYQKYLAKLAEQKNHHNAASGPR